ncbi:MAG: M23 family metallopeptidase [Campylobacterota bacterium]|nr:M23 family metallopeptidase [Campylobacterota bacterium]
MNNINRNKPMFRDQKKSGGLWKFILFVLIVIGAGGYIYTSEKFERVAPKLSMDNSVFWNKKDKLKINIEDNGEIKEYQVIVDDGKNKFELARETLQESISTKNLEILFPSNLPIQKDIKKLNIIVKATDKSFWNLFAGNSATQTFSFNIDTKKPNVKIVSHSYSMTKGGSALIIFKATDENLKELYIDTNRHKFKVQPYKKAGYFVSLIAWEFNQDNFDPKIIAVDRAGNVRKRNIPIYLKEKIYKVSYIKASDRFIDGKITDLASSDSKYDNVEDRLGKLKAINEDMRIANEVLIHKLSSTLSKEPFKQWKIKKFYPLKSAAVVATFGDERHYYYQDKSNEISLSYHVGLDLASTKNAPIFSSNKGKVVYAAYNGIYGKMPMIDHGLGLFSLYGHCSSILVDEGQEVKVGDKIAQTGKSGLALGDHLHFGILVQGVEVRIAEWMDQNWIKINIDNIFKEADGIIGL